MREMNEEMKNFVESIPEESIHCAGYECKIGKCPFCFESKYKVGGEESNCASCIIRNIKHELKDRMRSTRNYRVSVLVNARSNDEAINRAKCYFDSKNVRVDVED